MYKFNLVFASMLVFAGCVMTEAASEDPVQGEAVESSEALDDFALTSELATAVTEEGITEGSLAAPVEFGYRCCYCEQDCDEWDNCNVECYCAYDDNKESVAKAKAEDRCRIRLDDNDYGCWFDSCTSETAYQ